ncbi:hypothetical protein BOTCAL_0391g00040 [Botryotinia calthae]|uniref:NB-ARC domain-containing protein n=1 Tax=Botryotinia calthae TaxID=38488 RepID=A0A4Y8CTG4_9HELO|nr:hypothetical protein BOTCAL_0391g00040 [Botryotinia calthae]
MDTSQLTILQQPVESNHWTMRDIKNVLEPTATAAEQTISYKIGAIKPTLGHFYQFSRIFETRLAPGLQADFFWGILGLLLKLTTQDTQALSQIPRMLKSLGYKAESFKDYYYSSKDKFDQIKEACFDIQIQLVEFFTSAVRSMRGEEEEKKYDERDGLYGQGDPWLLLQRRFTATNTELIETIARVEKLASARLSGPHHHSSSDTATLTQQFRSMMRKKPPRFFNRDDTFEKIDQALGQKESNTSFRSVALFGLGGVGKSSIAARHVEKKIQNNEYDPVIWVFGEKTDLLRQSFTDIAIRLNLPGAQPNLHDDNLVLDQDWLQFTGKWIDCEWLIVYDNVESADLLMPYWPEASHGKAIITTRNHSLAYEPATSGLEITSRERGPSLLTSVCSTYFVLGILERQQNRYEAAEASFIEAQNLWLKGDQTKFHPFNGGCIYNTGVVCLDQGKVEAAVKHLRDSLEITKFHADDMPVEHARGLFKLSEALLQDSYDSDEATGLRDEAELYLSRRDPQTTSFAREEDYNQWVPIFWR